MANQTEMPRVSLAVWDIPSTVVAGEHFAIKAGAKSSAGNDLRGSRIEVCDADGAVIASHELRHSRWPGTDALAWTEIFVPAPAEPGAISLSAQVKGDTLSPPHRDGSFAFNVVVTPPPDHTVTVEVVAQETGAALEGTEIRLSAYRATTDASGKAALRVAKGCYDLHSWKTGYEAPPLQVEVDEDVTVRVESAKIPEENVDRAWKG